MKIFSGGKSKLKENSAYRNSKDEENEIHETTNKDIDELRFTIERLLNLINKNIDDVSSSYYDILKEKRGKEKRVLMQMASFQKIKKTISCGFHLKHLNVQNVSIKHTKRVH